MCADRYVSRGCFLPGRFPSSSPSSSQRSYVTTTTGTPSWWGWGDFTSSYAGNNVFTGKNSLTCRRHDTLWSTILLVFNSENVFFRWISCFSVYKWHLTCWSCWYNPLLTILQGKVTQAGVTVKAFALYSTEGHSNNWDLRIWFHKMLQLNHKHTWIKRSL